MAFLGGGSGNYRPKPASAPTPAPKMCPHCGKDTSAPPDRQPAAEHSADDKVVAQHYIDELERAHGLTSWETEFLTSVSDQFKKRGSLSPKQIATLRKIYDEKCQ